MKLDNGVQKISVENDLEDFADFNDCFMNYSTYTVVLKELEKNN